MDESQSDRLTQIVIKRTHKVLEIQKFVKKYANVSESKKAIHLNALGVDKGTAVEYIVNNSPQIDDDKVVAIGDSQIDAPMLKKAAIGFALKNADGAAVDAADVIITGGKYFDGVLLAFNHLDSGFPLDSFKSRSLN